MKIEDIVGRCEALYEDLDLECVRRWKEADESRRAVGFLPVFVPREIVHAAGMLPVGIMGGADLVEIIRGDACFQSYICHIPRSVMELSLAGRLDALDGFLFPSTCDVIRNLSGMWKLSSPEMYVRYVDLPQNMDASLGGRFFVREMREIAEDMGRLSGIEVTDDRLRASIAVMNEGRALYRRLYDLRSEKPWLVPTYEAYLLLRAANVLPPEETNDLVRTYLELAPGREVRPMDNIRVVVEGAFCEQPPLGLIRTLEQAGCYVVDDDFVLVTRWFREDVATDGDPFEALADAFLRTSVKTSSVYAPDEKKGAFLIRKLRDRRADGIVFAAPSFCDPALLDRPLLQKALEAEKIPYTSFKYAENTGQFANIREQVGTFADSIKLWDGSPTS